MNGGSFAGTGLKSPALRHCNALRQTSPEGGAIRCQAQLHFTQSTKWTNQQINESITITAHVLQDATFRGMKGVSELATIGSAKTATS
jgi:hypothetical protein